jgi:predicted acylesterase/phospholipase RssA
MLRGLFAGREAEILSHPHYRLHVLTVRGRWPLTRDSRFHTPFGFGLAALANLVARRHLAWFIERTIFVDAREEPRFGSGPFDAFNTHRITLDAGNLGEALLASASIPMVLQGVRDIPSAPPGIYWDGGIIDYHLALPYARAAQEGKGGIVLYPHFSEHIVPGWLDKAFPWRRAARGPNRGWLDNVLIVAPSQAFLRTLPRAKLPDRNDFKHYGLDHEQRIRNWQQAIGAGQRLRDEFAAFVEKPDIARIRAL